MSRTNPTSFADDDDDVDEENVVGFSHPTLAQSPQPDKGKIRAREPEQLAAPSTNGPSSSSLSGHIGSSASGGPQSARQTVGGVQVETRYAVFDETVECPSTILNLVVRQVFW